MAARALAVLTRLCRGSGLRRMSRRITSACRALLRAGCGVSCLCCGISPIAQTASENLGVWGRRGPGHRSCDRAGQEGLAHPAQRFALDGTGALFAKPPPALPREPRLSSRSRSQASSPPCRVTIPLAVGERGRVFIPIPLLCLPSVACGGGGPSSMSGPPNFCVRPLARPPEKIGSPAPRAAALTRVRPRAAGFPVNVPDLPDHRMP